MLCVGDLVAKLVLTVAVVALFSAGRLFAHDLWLIPPEKPAPGKPIRIKASVGMDFPKSEHAHDTSRYPERLAIGPDGKPLELKSAGKDETEMVGLLELEAKEPGIYAVAVRTAPRVLALSAEKFNEYLISDGMPHIYLLRAKEKTLDKEARERYSKSPKALLRVGQGGGGDATRPLGLPLEIVPLADPFALKPGDTLKVRVLFQGKALPEANLGWAAPGDGVARGYVRTDAKGEALVPIAGPGLMTLRLTHMTRPKAADYEWESFWTSLTFRLEK